MKLYSEKEIGAILKRAAELSLEQPGTNASGLSIEELQHIGQEAGLDPDLILRAAADLQRDRPDQEPNMFGGPVSYANEFVLEGEIDHATWEEMIAGIRGTFKEPGVVSTRENVFEWTSRGETEKAQVTARVAAGRTTISLFWAEPLMGFLPFIPTLIGTIISLPITFESLGWTGLPAAALILSMFLSLFTASRFAVSRLMDKKISTLRQLETQLEMMVSRKMVDTRLEQDSSDPSRTLLQDTLASDTTEQPPSVARRTRS